MEPEIASWLTGLSEFEFGQVDTVLGSEHLNSAAGPDRAESFPMVKDRRWPRVRSAVKVLGTRGRR